MPHHKWPTKNECKRIQRKALRLGAERVEFKYAPHVAWFKHLTVDFSFYPLKCQAVFLNPNCFSGGKFVTKEEADEIKKEMDTALKFIEYLKDFETQLSDHGTYIHYLHGGEFFKTTGENGEEVYYQKTRCAVKDSNGNFCNAIHLSDNALCKIGSDVPVVYVESLTIDQIKGGEFK